MTVPQKQPGQIRGFQHDADPSHMYECVGSGPRRSRPPDTVVVDDDMGVEVRLQEGPSGAVAGSRLQPSRGAGGAAVIHSGVKVAFQTKVHVSFFPEFIMKLIVQFVIAIISWIFNMNSFLVLKF